MPTRPRLPAIPEPSDETDPEDLDDDAPDELETETGLDLSEASPMDADHVLDDEESARIKQAPD